MAEPCLRPACPGRPGTIQADGLCDACWKEPKGPAPPRPTGRSRVGAGIVYVPPAPELDPSKVVERDAHIAEEDRYCGHCHAPVGRGRGGQPGALVGRCEAQDCRWPFDFRVKLRHGDLVEKQYEVDGTLAHGGQGWIFLARDTRLNNMLCVLKGRRDSADPDADEAAKEELRALATLSHPGIVKIHNLVQHPDHEDSQTMHRYIVMEFEPGHSLEHRRQEDGGSIEVTQALAFLHAAMPALGYLHEHGFVYCDFKPENLIHAGDAVTLIDLGAAWRMGAGPEAQVFATPGFRAPELRRTGPTVATDIYAAGRTLALLVCGVSRRWSLDDPGPPPREAHAALRRHDCLLRYLERACAVSPADRFVDAEEMAEALLGLLCQIAAAVEDTPKPHRSERWGPPNTQLERLDWDTLPSPILPRQPSLPNQFTGVAGADPHATIRVAQAGKPLSWADRAVLVQAYCELAVGAPVDGEAEAHLTAAEQAASEIDPATDPAVAAGTEPARTSAVVVAARTYLQGIVALAAGDPERAVGHFQAAYRAAPGEPACALALAATIEASSDGKRLGDAEVLYHQVATTDPTWVGAIAGRARVLERLHRAHEGAGILTSVPEVHPLRHEALTMACRTIPEGGYNTAVAVAAGALVATSRPRHRSVREAELAAAFYLMSLAAQPERDDELAARAATALRDQAKGLPEAEREERHRLLDRAAWVQPWRTWRPRER